MTKSSALEKKTCNFAGNRLRMIHIKKFGSPILKRKISPQWLLSPLGLLGPAKFGTRNKSNMTSSNCPRFQIFLMSLPNLGDEEIARNLGEKSLQHQLSNIVKHCDLSRRSIFRTRDFQGFPRLRLRRLLPFQPSREALQQHFEPYLIGESYQSCLTCGP